jgi:hypothetical protein
MTRPCRCAPFVLPDANTYPYLTLEVYHSCANQRITYEKRERAVKVRDPWGVGGWSFSRELYWEQTGVRTERF